MPRKKEQVDGVDDVPVGRGAPAGIIRNPIHLPPMRNIKDGGPPFDSDEDYELDELLGDELAKVEEQIG